MKQLKPVQLILLASIFTAIIEVIFIYILFGQFNAQIRVKLFFLFLLFFITNFFTYYFIFQQYIYKKIKLIFKFIRSVKGKKTKIKNKDVLQNVEDEVFTWKKKQEKEISQLKKMAEFRKKYIGNVSHELKTPLFNIQGYLDSLLLMKKQDKKQEKFIKKALENTNRLETIIKDLEMISKSETGNLELKYEKFNIKILIKEVIESFEIQAFENNIELGFKTGKCPDFFVKADRERIRQVLNNLIANAINYNKKNGKVLVSCYDMDEEVLIEITDTGIGIEQKHLPHLFERFYRVDKNRSRKKGGSGLGLAIVKHIIEAHEQRVHVRSSPGIGTTLGFTLKKATS